MSRRNHSFLYILRPDGEQGESQRIGESNSVLPLLWQILLAGSERAADCLVRKLDGPVVFAVATEAASALVRYRRLTRFLCERSDLQQRIAGLKRYLQGSTEHLEQLIAEWTLPEAQSPVLCATFDEMLTPGYRDVATFLAAEQAAWLERWRAIDDAIRARDATGLQMLIQHFFSPLGYESWRAWSGLFGLALFEHGYFAAAFRRPLPMEYCDHRYDPLGDEDDLGGGLHRFKEGKRWGVRRGERTVIPPAWDRILRAGDRQDIVWVKRGRHFGLAALDGERAGHVLLQPCLDAVNPFEQQLAVVRVHDKMGFLLSDGRWHLQPIWDDAWPFCHGYAVVAAAERLGYIDERGRYMAQPQFDAADHFTVAGVARVRKGATWGLLRNDGSFALPLQYSQIEWLAALSAWRCTEGGQQTLMQADGSAWIASPWDVIEPMDWCDSIRVQRASRVGVLTRSGVPLISCEYHELTAVSCGVAPMFIARRGAKVGLLDVAGTTVLPFESSCIEPLEAHATLQGTAAAPTLLRVYSADPGSRPKGGIWDLATGSWRVPCQYDYLWLVAFNDGGDYGFLVANKRFQPQQRTPEFSVGILAADGSILFDVEYAWIAERKPPTTLGTANPIRGAIHHAWSVGDAVPSARRDGSLEMLRFDCASRGPRG